MESLPSRRSTGGRSALCPIASWSAVVALGLLQVWAHRNAMNPDGISYLEIGRAGISDWQGFVNAYWSPLYPFLLCIALRCLHPSSFWEFPVSHFLNFAIYLASYGCLQFLIKQFQVARRLSIPGAEREYLLSDEELPLMGTVYFLWASRYWLGTVLVSPDLLVSVVFYLATAMLLRIRCGKPGWLSLGLLGVILGLGYLAKAPMFLLGFVFVFAAYRLLQDRTQALLRAAVALFFFLTIAVPFVTVLSRNKHRFTFSDTSTISYAEYINQMPLFVGWRGEIPGGGTPAHPTRQLLAEPPLFEFATPVPGSYPPWYDPSYWYEGVRAHFSLKGELRAIFRAANEYLKMFSRSGALWCVLFALIWITRQGGGLDVSNRPWWPVLLPGLAAFVMYSLVHAETRFVVGAGLVLVFWALSRVQAAAVTTRKSLRVAKRILLLAPSLAIGWSATSDVRRLARPEPFVAWEAAAALHAAGLPPGANVGYIGTGLEAYWAHLARLRIIAEIPDPGWSRFAALDSEAKQAVLEKFARAGVLAVVTRHAELARGDPAWQRLAGTDLFVLILAPPEPANSPRASEN
jgi:hypothetical protein